MKLWSGKVKAAICSRYNTEGLPGYEPRCYVECSSDFVIGQVRIRKKEEKEDS